MDGRELLGNSQFLTYDGYVDAEIGVRVREKLDQLTPKITQKQFALTLKMTPDSLSRALMGKRAFTAVELVNAAQVLGTSAHWLVTGAPDPFAVKVAGRQTFDHAVKTHNPLDWSAIDDMISNIALAYMQVYPATSGALMPAVPASPADARHTLLQAFGSNFIRQLAEATEVAFGVDVVRVGELRDGLAIEVIGRNVIVVGETGNWFFENWSIAHELGHLAHGDLSERGTDACDDPKSERAANAFAAELLLPKAEVRATKWGAMDEVTLARYIWQTGVSTQALENRLAKLGIVPSDSVRSALRMNTQALLRKSEILKDKKSDLITERMTAASSRRFPEHLLSAHLDAVSEGKIGAAFLAWMLGVAAPELDEQLAPPMETNVDVGELAKQLGLIDPAS